jgi:NADH-quinone oxidoreductase subunit J
MEELVFWIFAVVAVGGAIAMVWSRNPVHSALGLMATMFSVAVLYIANAGHFLAAAQVLVYAGAVMTLFLFVIMLIGVDKAEDRRDAIRGQRTAALVVSAAFALLLIRVGASAWVTGAIGGPEPLGTAEAVSDRLFNEWVLPFELIGILLIIAAAGTIALGLYRPQPLPPSHDDAGDEGEPTTEEEAP